MVSAIVLLGSLAGSAMSAEVPLVLLPEKQFGAAGGRCLDGSMAGYYYAPPKSADSSVWIVNIVGGGACSDKKACKKRAQTSKGSSTFWKSKKALVGILSDDSTINPDFHDAHRVNIPYCTGDMHLGTIVEPSSDQWGYYFSGHLNLKNILEHVLATVPATKKAKQFLLTGGSAGGIGTILGCDFVQEFLQQQGSAAQVSCAPTDGWFVPGFAEDQPNPAFGPSTWPDWKAGKVTDYTKKIGGGALYKSFLPESCLAALGVAGPQCISAHVAYPYVKAPMYIAENMFDLYQLKSSLGLPESQHSSTQGKEFMAYFGRAMRNSTHLVVDHPTGKKGDGLFLASCYAHGKGNRWQDATTKVGGFTSLEGVADWFFKRSTVPAVLVDDCALAPGIPCNPTCPGLGPAPAPSPPGPTPSGGCPLWCNNNVKAWAVKCTFAACTGCTECTKIATVV